MSTTLAGSVKDLSTAAVTSNTVLRFILRGLNGNIPRVSGTALVAQNPTPYPNLYYFDFTPDSSGNFSGTLYSTRDAAGTGNGDIEAGGSFTAVWYGMVLIVSGQPGPEIAVHAKNGATLDPSNVTPITTTPVVTAPTGDTTYLRLDGGNNPMTGQLAIKNGSVASPGLTFASSLTTGFWRQAADVIGVSIAGVLKWLVNSVGPLFGSGEAVVWSSNADPSAAVGDSFLSRIGAAILGIGSTNGGTNGELRLSKVNKITLTQPATGATLTLADNSTLTGQGTGTIVNKDSTDTLTNKTYDTAGAGNVFKINGTAISAITGTGSVVLASSPTITSPTINTGVSQGSGFKHQRFGSSCTTSTTQGTSCTDTRTWTSAFADANYSIVCQGITPSGAPVGLAVESKSASNFVVRIYNLGVGATASYAATECFAAHD